MAIAGRVLDGAAAAGGVPIEVPRGRAVRIGTPLLSLAVRGGRGGSVLLVGTVAPDVLERAVRRAVGGAGVTDVIATRGLVKRFGRVTAVAGVDLRIPAGIRFGLLGPNGSGKTTLVRMLLGLVHADRRARSSCSASRCRARAARVLPRVGALVEGPAAWPHLSGRTNLRLLDAAGPGRRGGAGGAGSTRRSSGSASAAIDRRPVRAYSLGMRQRLGIAAALLRGPELLLLDEPTNGLDPRGIGEIRDAADRAERGRHDRRAVQPPARRGRRAVQPGRGDGRGPAGARPRTSTALRAPTGRVLVRTPDPAAARRRAGRAGRRPLRRPRWSSATTTRRR